MRITQKTLDFKIVHTEQFFDTNQTQPDQIRPNQRLILAKMRSKKTPNDLKCGVFDP